jgi:outer membrane protein
MQKIIKLSLLIAIAFFSKMGAKAQTSEIKAVSLKECLTQAMSNNTRLINAQLDEERTSYQVKEVRSAGLPQFSASAGFDDYFDIPTQLIPGIFFDKPGEMIPVQFGTQYNTSAGLNASQLLFSQSYFTALSIARKVRELGSLNTEKTRQEIVYNIAQMYYVAKTTASQKENLVTNLKNLERVEAITNLQLQGGVIRKVDADRVRVSIINLRSQLQNVEAVQTQQLNMLKYLMGTDLQQGIILSDSLTIDSLVVSTNNVDPNHIDLQLLDKNFQLEQYNLKLARSDWFPTLTAYAGYNYQNMGDELKLFGGSAEWYKTSVVGLKLNVPLFSGFKVNSKISQSQVKLKQLALLKTDTERALQMDLENARKKFSVSYENYIGQKSNMELAQNIFNITQKQYSEGVAPLTDLLQSQSALSDAQSNFTQSLVQMKLAELDLLKANGTLLNLLNL